MPHQPQKEVFMTASYTSAPGEQSRAYTDHHDAAPSRRLSTETKSSFKTTEFWLYVLAVVGVLIASYVVKTTGSHADYFRADRAWFYVVLLTLGYLVSRGLAKSGSRDHYDA
jgi:hypothetical protein